MNIKNSTLIAFCFLLALAACETEDVKPIVKPDAVSISLNATVISEAAGTAELTATISKASTSNVEVKLAYTGKAVLSTDYSSNMTLTIPAGSLSVSTTILAIQDTLKEGNEDVVIAIDAVTGATEDGVQVVGLNIEDDDVVATANIVLNEILYDPASAVTDGDANGDGTRDAAADEFIELINNSSNPVNLSGYKIYDSTGLAGNTPNHIIPNGTIIQPGKALVIFGGGTPTGTFGGATVQTSTSGNLNLTNAGDLLTVTDSSNIVVLTFDIEPLSNNPDESYTRSPDITGIFEQHATVTPGVKFSPGTKINGTAF